ncbi:DUF4123 domain-containing protein [Luteimonas sp. SJ-92]|uniref:DUF4123 domain-containing protein n=1 Tax=Luteimonas salinisoli TaxID=2752307 RepID=A0A853JJP0_9GAMM|nr:DUF4123 domain-containing protein [Luteimonas salinisoli]NZA28590.1 DUF4123 domain-containing protein [Luteimonas salinisoli]
MNADEALEARASGLNGQSVFGRSCGDWTAPPVRTRSAAVPLGGGRCAGRDVLSGCPLAMPSSVPGGRGVLFEWPAGQWNEIRENPSMMRDLLGYAIGRVRRAFDHGPAAGAALAPPPNPCDGADGGRANRIRLSQPVRQSSQATMNAVSSGERLRARLFADVDDAYAVLDGCRTPDLPRRLRLAGAEYWCLLSEGLDPVLTECAPYLVHVHRDAAQAAEVLRTCWDRHGGIALCPPSGGDGRALREHLRAWLRIPGPGGASRSFRFYDPCVLLAMLPAMVPERRNAFLAPLGRLYVEGSAPGSLVEFRRGGCAQGRLLRAPASGASKASARASDVAQAANLA